MCKTKEKIIEIVKNSMCGVLPVNMTDKLAIRIADGLVLNGAKFKEVD